MSNSWETEAQKKNYCWYLPRPKPDGYHGGMPLGAEKWLVELAENKIGNNLSDEDILQPFAGMGKRGVTVDINPELDPDYIGDAHNLEMFDDESFKCVLCDPPFSDQEADEIFDTPELKWGKWSSEAYRVLEDGGIIILYHKLLLPNPKPSKLSLVANVCIVNRTWHLPRIARFYKKDMTND